MAYQMNPEEDELIKQRIKQILREKIRNPNYDGRGLVGGAYDDFYEEEYYGSARPKKVKDPRRVASGKIAAKCNPWIMFYRQFVRQHKNKGYSGKQLSKMASKEYRALYGDKEKTKKPKKVRTKRKPKRKKTVGVSRRRGIGRV